MLQVYYNCSTGMKRTQSCCLILTICHRFLKVIEVDQSSPTKYFSKDLGLYIVLGICRKPRTACCIPLPGGGSCYSLEEDGEEAGEFGTIRGSRVVTEKLEWWNTHKGHAKTDMVNLYISDACAKLQDAGVNDVRIFSRSCM